MAALPEEVTAAWENREGPMVFITVGPDGNPNAVYATSMSIYDGETILVADNYFEKTLANIESGSRGSILFFTKDRKSYQVKGGIDYHTSGRLFEDMKRWNPDRFPGKGVAALKVEEVYSGATRL